MFFFKSRVYADAAAATPLSPSSRRELVRLLGLFGNAGALHAEALGARRVLESARRRIAASIGAHADEIIFTASGTEANNLALQGLLRPFLHDGGGASAVVSAIEHQSVLGPLRALRREGLAVTEVGVDQEGIVSPDSIVEKIEPGTKLVSVQLVNSEIGSIEPVREIVQGVRRLGAQAGAARRVYVHTDASQAPLWLPLNVEKLGIDLMTLDGQKILGPKGIGCLYVRRGTPLEPVLWGGKQEQGLRGGTENVPLAGAFAVALEEAQASAARTAARTARVGQYLWQEIRRLIPEALLNGPPLEDSAQETRRAANNLNVSIPGLEAEMAVVSMDALGVAVSTRSVCTIGSDEPSHVIQAIGVPAALAGTAIRITLLPDASYRDARRIARALFETAGRYKKR